MKPEPVRKTVTVLVCPWCNRRYDDTKEGRSEAAKCCLCTVCKERKAVHAGINRDGPFCPLCFWEHCEKRDEEDVRRAESELESARKRLERGRKRIVEEREAVKAGKGSS